MSLTEDQEFALGDWANLLEENEKLRARIAELEAELAGQLEDAEAVKWCEENGACATFYWEGPLGARKKHVNLYRPSDNDDPDQDEVDADTLPAAVAAFRARLDGEQTKMRSVKSWWRT